MKTISFISSILVICISLTIVPSVGHAAQLVIGDTIGSVGDQQISGNVHVSGSGNGIIFPDGSKQTAATLQGPAGPQGPQGSIGLTGPAGPQGPQGIQGPPGPGTITSVNTTTNSGLTGGATSGDVTLSVSFSGTGAANSAARSDHNHDSVYQKNYANVAVVAHKAVGIILTL